MVMVVRYGTELVEHRYIHRVLGERERDEDSNEERGDSHSIPRRLPLFGIPLSIQTMLYDRGHHVGYGR